MMDIKRRIVRKFLTMPWHEVVTIAKEFNLDKVETTNAVDEAVEYCKQIRDKDLLLVLGERIGIKE